MAVHLTRSHDQEWVLPLIEGMNDAEARAHYRAMTQQELEDVLTNDATQILDDQGQRIWIMG